MRSIVVPFDAILDNERAWALVDAEFVREDEWVNNRGPSCWHFGDVDAQLKLIEDRCSFHPALRQRMKAAVARYGFVDVKNWIMAVPTNDDAVQGGVGLAKMRDSSINDAGNTPKDFSRDVSIFHPPPAPSPLYPREKPVHVKSAH